MKLTLSTLIFLSTLAVGTTVNAADDVDKLKAKLASVTAEADALWVYVQSGPENPDVRALNRAMALWQKRGYGRKK